MTITKHFKEKVFPVTFFPEKSVCNPVTVDFFLGDIHDEEILQKKKEKRRQTWCP